MPTTPGNVTTLSLSSGCLHGRIPVDRRSQEAIFSSLCCHLQREVTGLAVNFAGLPIAALNICIFELPSLRECHMRLHICQLQLF